MPHITIEYSGNQLLDEPWVMLQVNKCMLASGLFQDADIKTRMVRLPVFRMGVTTQEEGGCAFVAANLALLSGREQAVREHLGIALRRTLERACHNDDLAVQVSVHVTELASEMYFKNTVGPRKNPL